MDEDDFTERMAATPEDDDLRRVYADWLGGRDGDPRAESRIAFLRAQVSGVSVSPEAMARLHNNDARWLAQVDRTTIVECPGGSPHDGVRFAATCPRRWEDLVPSEEDALVRYCEACRERVYYCTSADEARQHALQRRCVALALASTSDEPYHRPLAIGRVQAMSVATTRFSERTGLHRLPVAGDDAVWFVGAVEGQPIAVTFQHAGRCGHGSAPEEVADRMRFVVPLYADVDADLWPQWRVPDDPTFSFTGRNLAAFDAPARRVLTRFAHQVGAITVRPRARLRLPAAIFPDAPLVVVHWIAVPTDEVGLERELRGRGPALHALASTLEATFGAP